MNEEDFVVEQFQKNFSNSKHKIALYGIGKNTAAILDKVDSSNIAGLIDVETTGETIYGKPVLSLDDVICSDIKTIVIIAREAIINIIYKRIEFLKEKGISIYNVKGEALNEKDLKYNNFDLAYWKSSEQALKEEIDKHNLISFDIFDTLLMRQTLRPSDIFELVEFELKQKHNISIDFKKKRQEAEASLPITLATLDEIYEEFARLSNLDEATIATIKRIELETEKRALIAREKLVEVFEYAKAKGKSIYLTSDTYFSKTQLEEFLAHSNIKGYEKILISSVEKKTKKDGSMFEFLKDLAQSKKILHIGDNRLDDIEQANKKGLDTFLVYSAYEMLMASSMQSVLSDITSLNESLFLGLFIAKALNDPFALHDSQGVFTLKTPSKLGYLFLAPLFLEFTKWLSKKVKESQIEQVLFPSRDGYLIYKLYNELTASRPNLPQATYFKTSRRLLNVTSLKSEKELLFLLQKPFKGSKKELLQIRYGIEEEPSDSENDDFIDADTSKEDLENYILKYKEQIIQNSREEASRYLKYLDTKNLINSKKQAIFDFVCGGTIPYFLEKLLDKKLLGCFFATSNFPNELFNEEYDFDTAYGHIQSYALDNNIAKYYLFLESVLVDEDTTIISFNEALKPIFEDSNQSNYEKIKDVHSGIFSFVSDIQALYQGQYLDSEGELLDFVDKLFGYLFSPEVKVDEALKKTFVNDDKYFGVAAYRAWA